MNANLFAHPEWQAGLLATFALAVGAVAAARLVTSRRARRLLGPRGVGLGSWASDAALLTAVAAIALALLGPRLGERTLWVRSSGVDVVVLVDVSPSMMARDTPPSRLTRAREAARRVLSELAPGDRVALAAFSGRGVLLTPLTPDTRAIRRMLPALTPDLIQERGSQIGEGVRAALGAFDASSDRPRSLFVVSDGEDPARGDLGIAEAVRLGVRVVAAVFGSKEGVTIPQRGGLLLHDAGGRVVVSHRELAALSRLVAATDGRLLAANRWGEIDVSLALETLGAERGSTPGERVARRVPATRVAPVAALAFALLVLELARGSRRRRVTRPALAGALAVTLAAGALGSGGLRELEAEVRARPRDAGALVALGVARAEAGDAEEATRAFFAAAAGADDPELAALAYYDLGVAELALGRWAAASQAFYDALALRPEDLEAKFNLEWALRALGNTAPRADTEPSAEPPPPTPPEQSDPHPAEASPPREGERERVTRDLDSEAVERWLEQVPDDPARALRDTARSARRPRQAPRAPGW